MKLPQNQRSLFVCATWMIFVFGCTGGESPTKPIAAPKANTALVATLEAWKAGRRSTGEFFGSNPAIGVVDTLRSLRPLIKYEVVGPLATVENVRPFAVRLVLGEPSETITTRYLVVGQDPIWVFRQEDYDLILHWEHKMEPNSLTPQGLGESKER